MITVEQAEAIIQSRTRDFGREEILYDLATGRVLAENLLADRDLPPFNRPTVDGIAIRYAGFEKGNRSFGVTATQAAGDPPAAIGADDECVEIMTGAALDSSVDTVIRYEDLEMKAGTATIQAMEVRQGQNIHRQGADSRQGDTVAPEGCLISPALLGLCASIGKTTLTVKKLPRVAIITTGDEMVSADAIPSPYQLRRSNDMTIKATLSPYHIQADVRHLHDDYTGLKTALEEYLKSYDVLLLCGGVSMGKFDYVPEVLNGLGVEQLFHKVRQRPGKPFWFGAFEDKTTVFAFPGNPVSVYMCLHRYFIPWLEKCLGLKPRVQYAVLKSDIGFGPQLQYFAQVKLSVNHQGQLEAEPVAGNGSGDVSGLIHADAFIELPLDKSDFKAGEAYQVWKFNPNSGGVSF